MKAVLDLISKSFLGFYNLNGVKEIQWGRSHEQTAISQFEEVYKKKVKKCGIFLDDSGLLGASPDGLVDDGILEVKCPFRFRDKTISEALANRTDYILRIENGAICLNKQHNYYHQIQGQLHIAKKHKCYLIIWTTIDFLVYEVRIDKDWNGNLEILKNFYFNTYISEVFK